MIFLTGKKFERLRQFLMSGSRRKILEDGSLQNITEKCKGLELRLLSFRKFLLVLREIHVNFWGEFGGGFIYDHLILTWPLCGHKSLSLNTKSVHNISC